MRAMPVVILIPLISVYTVTVPLHAQQSSELVIIVEDPRGRPVGGVEIV